MQNLRADPRVQVRVAGESQAARARVVDAVAEADLARRVQVRSVEKYGWGDGLVVELTPEP